MTSMSTAKEVANKQAAGPFLKWAGGKRWLARKYRVLFETNYDRYVEPFLGGASMFFALQPRKSILADRNERLIEAYVAIKSDPGAIAMALSRYQELHSDEYYYSERNRNYPGSTIQRAAQLIYLNRTCWNGLYRVNRKGEFNVPRGTKNSVVLETDNFNAISDALRGAALSAQDFEKTLSEAGEGDLVYVDPPYTVNHSHNGFGKYNEEIFSWDDQKRLKRAVSAAKDRGAKVAVSNADHVSIRELYADVGKVESISRKSVISADPEYRRNVDEVLIRSWSE